MIELSTPFGFDIMAAESRMAPYDRHYERKLSDLRGVFADHAAYERLLSSGDPVVYEVYEIQRPEVSGELLHGLSIVHAGSVGDEFYMTKGHFHAVRETAEVYSCLRGHGLMMMENERGESAVEEFRPGRVVYVPPCWAHRSINTGDVDLVTFFVYPGHAGHDYGSIERSGFSKRVMRRNSAAVITDHVNGSVAKPAR